MWLSLFIYARANKSMRSEQELLETLGTLGKEANSLPKDSIQRGNVYLAMVCVFLAAIYDSVKK